MWNSADRNLLVTFLRHITSQFFGVYLLVKKLLGENFPPERAPIILDEYANTSSAGSIIAFHKHNHLTNGQKGIICSFGAGYSICSILLEKE